MQGCICGALLETKILGEGEGGLSVFQRVIYLKYGPSDERQ